MDYLPREFEVRMKEMLQEEYGAFLESYQEARQYGLRVNTLKLSAEEFEEMSKFHLRKIPWISNGFYYEEGDAPGRHPHYLAGLYYLQEPSAMTPASRLPIEPGDRVLDLCAAPGGKATELGERLRGEGVLVANDISNSRAKALLRNIEMAGIKNAFVTNEIPAKLARKFTGYFDKILVDAPCSGEGMFRKDEGAAKAWDVNKPEECARLQRGILESAVSMLKPGGYLLYSTCTFAPQENEGVVAWLIETYPEMKLQDMENWEGFSQGNPDWGNQDEELRKCIRIWPHRMKGEGHFLALFKKNEQDADRKTDIRGIDEKEPGRGKGVKGRRADKGKTLDKKTKQLMEAFFEDISMEFSWEQVDVRANKVYLVPDLPADLKGIYFLRNGLYMGELKKERFEPSQPFALALQASEYVSVLNLSRTDERLERYLRGETIAVALGECKRENGWQLICVENFSLGWGKLVNGVLKNKYLYSWRKS